jgi:hypothetical protein
MERRALGRREEPAQVTPPAPSEPPVEDGDLVIAKDAHDFIEAQLARTEINKRMAEIFQ